MKQHELFPHETGWIGEPPVCLRVSDRALASMCYTQTVLVHSHPLESSPLCLLGHNHKTPL